MSIRRPATRVAALVLALGGCRRGPEPRPDRDRDEDTVDTGGSVIEFCTAIVKPELPKPGATGVYYRATFLIGFSEAQRNATFALTKHSDGSAVTLGTLNWDDAGRNVSFAPTSPLEPSTAYTLAISYCDGAQTGELEFTTSATGAEVDDEDIVGNTYALDIADPNVEIVEPVGVGALLGTLLGQLGDTTIAVKVTGTDGGLTFLGSLVEGGNQDVCTETIDFSEFPADFDENPYFELDAPDGLSLTVSDVTVRLEALELSGAFTPGGADIEGIAFAGLIDTRQLVDLLGDLAAGGGDAAVCNLVKQVAGIDCVQCPRTVQNPGPFCLSLVATNIHAPGASFDLVERTAEDIENDPACAD